MLYSQICLCVPSAVFYRFEKTLRSYLKNGIVLPDLSFHLILVANKVLAGDGTLFFPLSLSLSPDPFVVRIVFLPAIPNSPARTTY